MGDRNQVPVDSKSKEHPDTAYIGNLDALQYFQPPCGRLGTLHAGDGEY